MSPRAAPEPPASCGRDSAVHGDGPAAARVHGADPPRIGSGGSDLEQIQADQQLILRIAEEGLGGPAWQQLVEHVYDYGRRSLHAFIHDGLLVARVRRAVGDQPGAAETVRKFLDTTEVSFADGSTEKFEGLSGPSWSRVFDREVAGVWVKSGDNASGDGPGYGEWFPSAADCDERPAPGQQPDADIEDVTTDDVAETPAAPARPATGSTGPGAPAAEVSGETDTNTGPAEGSDETAPAPDTAVLGVTIDRPVTAAGPDAQVAGMEAAAAPTSLAVTGTDAGWLLALAAALSVYGIIALDLTGRRARG